MYPMKIATFHKTHSFIKLLRLQRAYLIQDVRLAGACRAKKGTINDF